MGIHPWVIFWGEYFFCPAIFFTSGFEKKKPKTNTRACGAKKQGGPLEEILTSLKCDPKGATLVSPIW